MLHSAGLFGFVLPQASCTAGAVCSKQGWFSSWVRLRRMTHMSFLLCCTAVDSEQCCSWRHCKAITPGWDTLFCLIFASLLLPTGHTLLYAASVLFNSYSWCWTVVGAFACPGSDACRTIGLLCAASLIGAPLAVCWARMSLFFCSTHSPSASILNCMQPWCSCTSHWLYHTPSYMTACLLC